jgi:HEAT repeat protein
VPPGVDGIPGSPTGAPPPPGPTSAPRTQTLNTWQTWWHYNRWAHLEVDHSRLVDTGSGGFFLGHGERAQPSPLLRATKNQVRDLVQPALVRALTRGGQAEFEVYALHALAKLRDVPVLDDQPDFGAVAREFLKSANQTVAEKAVLALGIRGEDRFLPWLASILADSPEGRMLVGRSLVGERMRAFAAYGLGLLGERTKDSATRIGVYDALLGALPVERDEVQAACLLALGLAPMPAGEVFVEGSDKFTGKTRVDQVLAVLSFFEDESQPFVARCLAPNALARLVEGAPETVRGRVAYALLVASGPLTHEMREVQNAAVIALGQIGRSGLDPIDQEIRQHLEAIAFKSSADRSTRYLASIALAEVASRRGSGDEPFAGLAPTRKLFLRNLQRSRGETLAWTALALGILEEDAGARGEAASPDSGKALRGALEKARSSEVAGALSIALGMVHDPDAADLLHERMLETGDTYMRGYAALALGMIGATSAIEPIRQVLAASTHQSFLVENAAIALALLGDQETGSRLFGVLEDASNPLVQASVASAMGWVRDPRPLGDLCELLGDSRRNDSARAWTAVAIGRICDEDRWPWVGRLSVNVLYDLALPTLLEPIFETGLLDLP